MLHAYEKYMSNCNWPSPSYGIKHMHDVYPASSLVGLCFEYNELKNGFGVDYYFFTYIIWGYIPYITSLLICSIFKIGQRNMDKGYTACSWSKYQVSQGNTWIWKPSASIIFYGLFLLARIVTYHIYSSYNSLCTAGTWWFFISKHESSENGE